MPTMMSDSSISSSRKLPADAKRIVAKFVLFPVLLYGIVALANIVFVHLVDWRGHQNPNERLLWDPDLPKDRSCHPRGLGIRLFVCRFC